jgi:hypothetical protein
MDLGDTIIERPRVPWHTAVMGKHPKRPRDPNELAKLVADLATGAVDAPPGSEDSEATILGRMGGLKGGNARAKALSADRRREIAKKAASKRWSRG